MASASQVFGSPWFWVGGSLLGLVLWLSPIVRFVEPPVPAVKGTIAKFEGVDHQGRVVSAKGLEGRLWVGAKVAQPCAGQCTDVLDGMADLQRRLRKMRDRLVMVSFAEGVATNQIDKYAARSAANRARWHFVSTAHADVVQAWGMNAGVMVLVDDRGQVRGRYEPDTAGIDQLVRDITVITTMETGRVAQNTID